MEQTHFEEAAEGLQKTLNHEIPITRPMGLDVKSYDGHQLVLTAPLSKNINHKSTAFGGSINTIMTLAGWGLIHLLLEEHEIADCRVVIQNSSVRYLKPVHDDIKAACSKPPEETERFIEQLNQRGKARLELSSQVVQDGEIAASYVGRYVAFFDGEL